MRAWSTPFESVFADFFQNSGYHYLLAGDRLSGWVEVYQSKVGSPSAGASGLVAHLRKLFMNFGIPEILSSDGGPEFIATETQDFLTRWGVYHRKSSSHNPLRCYSKEGQETPDFMHRTYRIPKQ